MQTDMATLSGIVLITCWLVLCTDAAQNIAHGKTADISSVDHGGVASKGVDGNLNNRIHTADYQKYAWWRVDLGTQVTDARIVVFFNKDFKYRRPGLEFYVSATNFTSPKSPHKSSTSSWSPSGQLQLIHTTTGKYTDIPDEYTISTTEQWRYLLVYTDTMVEGDKYGPSLDFRELQVWACPEGLYDPDCTKDCRTRGCAGSSSCPYNTGVCQNGCQTEYKETDCQECSEEYYGMRCIKDCNQRNCDNQKTYQCTRTDYSCQCRAGWTGDDCRTACANTMYGNSCVKSCAARRCKVPSPTCDRFTGECSGGCGKAGYKLPDCTERCDDTHYGVNCIRICGDRKCRFDSLCDAATGACNGGCQAGWEGADCTKTCDSGMYGEDCLKTCQSRNCLTSSETCDRETGACPEDGCKAGWRGVDCMEACPSHLYWRNCANQCSERRCNEQKNSCNRTTGECPGGCQVGWSGTDCTSQCPTGTYLHDCSKRCEDRNCKGETSSCPVADGRCDTGCADGWTYVDCTTQCPGGKYGSNCNSTCGSCSGGDDACHHVTGTCSSGCASGFKPGLCQEECSDNTFGQDCKESCGKCNGTCHNVNGFCPYGCVDGFTGDMCIPIAAVPYGVIGGVCGAVVLAVIVIVIAVIVWRKRRKSPKSGQHDKIANGTDDNVYVNLAASEVRSSKTTQLQSGITPAKGRKIHTENKAKSSEEKPAGKVSETPLKSKPQIAVKPIVSKHLEESDVEDDPMDEVPGDAYYNLTDVSPIGLVTVPELAGTVKEVQQRQNGFLTEYNRLPSGFTAPYDDSQKPENAGKNKFRGYYPYDRNRVRLQQIPDVPGSDYINASFMESYNQKRRYIAAQAANKKTVGDFWRMIWEHKCNRIVMLTGLIEQTRVKCEKYWPDGETKHIDDLEIKTEYTDTRAVYTIRHIQVRSKSTDEQTTVVHYHYTTWPDHGVPNTLSLVKFIWDIRRTDADTDGPLLVHCSAGIGRTGTYIAVDSLYDQARDEGKVDVPAYVAEMRSQRKNMIQTHKQYECVFLCLGEMTTYGDTSLSSGDFVNMYSSRGMDAEVDGRSLSQLTELAVSEKSQADPNSHRMWVDGNREFIIKHSPSLARPKGYLLAVVPNRSLTKLLWKLVEENDVQTVVVVSKLEDEIIDSKGQSVKYGPITLTTQKTEELTTGLDMVTLQATETLQDREESRTVMLFKIKEPHTSRSIASLLQNHSQLQNFSTDHHPTVIVHSTNDAKDAVSLCIMSNILGQIIKDKRIDVIGHVRSYLKHFADVKLFKADVESFHEFAHRFLQMTDDNTMYANM